MMLTILIGTDWVANRDAIINRLAEDVKREQPGGILIVPELISHDTERRLCGVAGDTCSRFAEVLSFTRLAKRISEYEACPLKECLDNGGRLVAMASAVKQLHSKLKAYAAVETMPDFFINLLDAVDEFKYCCISPADLMEASRQSEGSFAQKLEELSLIMESYDSVCSRGKCDPRDQMSWLLDELEVSNYAQNHVFYIDGFPDFTRQHMNILKYLALTSANVTVSFTCDQIGSDAMAFEKAGETAQELVLFAKKENIEFVVKHIPSGNAVLTPVQKQLFQGDITAYHIDGIFTRQMDSLRKECDMAVQTVIELVQSGARYRDINIVCSDMAKYKNVLEMLFEKCDIPVYISGTEDVLETPSMTTVFAALDAVLGGYDRQDVLQYLKSMLSPLTGDACDLVENYALMWGIHGKKWTQEWTNHPNGLGQKWTSGAQRRLEQLNNFRRTAIDPLETLRKDLFSSVNLGEEVLALYRFLEQIQFADKLEKYARDLAENGRGRNAQILSQLWEILVTALEQLYHTLGDTAWEAENFSRLLRLLVSQYDVGTIPPVLDAVSIGPMNVMRCQQCKHLMVLGVEEGAVPSYNGTVGLLSDHERTALRKLGLTLTGGSVDSLMVEFADIYGVFTSAEKSIYASTSGGQPSFIYRRLSGLAVKEEETCGVVGTALRNPADAAAYLLRSNADSVSDWIQCDPVFLEIKESKDHSLGAVEPDNIKKLYGPELLLSASQIDRVAQCRLAYFLQYGLFAKERLVAEVDPAEFGTYVHAVLEKTVQRVMELGGFRCVSADEMVDIAKTFSDVYAEERFAELDSVRMIYLFARNWDELELIVRELWSELHNSEFQPVGFEVAFGDGCEVPAVDVSGKEMSAKLRGFVDRVDCWKKEQQNYFRVVDYKTGRKDFDYCDIYNGYGLQMLLYLFALEDANAEIVGNDGIPAGVQYFPARVPLVSADSILTDEEADALRTKLWKRKGLLLAIDEVLAAMESGETPQRMPYSRKKDGSISGDLADIKQFEMLKKYVFSKVGKMVDEIATGAVAPNPYTRGVSHNACSYCPYGSICHKSTVEGRRNYQAISDKQFWEDIEREVSGDGR